ELAHDLVGADAAVAGRTHEGADASRLRRIRSRGARREPLASDAVLEAGEHREVIGEPALDAGRPVGGELLEGRRRGALVELARVERRITKGHGKRSLSWRKSRFETGGIRV